MSKGKREKRRSSVEYVAQRLTRRASMLATPFPTGLRKAVAGILSGGEEGEQCGALREADLRTGGTVWPSKDTVGVLTVAPFHNSLGDISTADVTQRWLSLSGIPADHTSFWEPSSRRLLVVGGGELVGAPKHGPWHTIKPMMLPHGPHALNAVGIDLRSFETSDIEKLAQYRYVSVRDTAAAERLTDAGIDVRAVPCPASLQPYLPLEVVKQLPKYQCLRGLERDEYVVVHRHPSLSKTARSLQRAGARVVVVDMQAHARHPWPAGVGVEVPATHSAIAIKGIVQAASLVLTSSLHLAIFALSEGQAFACIDTADHQADKVRRYLERAGIEEAMSDPPELVHTAGMVAKRSAGVGALERARAADHLDSLAAVCLTVDAPRHGGLRANGPSIPAGPADADVAAAE